MPCLAAAPSNQSDFVRLRCFAETYGVLERVTIIEPPDNGCSKARVTKQIKT